jgi:hypothetical protein
VNSRRRTCAAPDSSPARRVPRQRLSAWYAQWKEDSFWRPRICRGQGFTIESSPQSPRQLRYDDLPVRITQSRTHGTPLFPKGSSPTPQESRHSHENTKRAFRPNPVAIPRPAPLHCHESASWEAPDSPTDCPECPRAPAQWGKSGSRPPRGNESRSARVAPELHSGGDSSDRTLEPTAMPVRVSQSPFCR